MIGTRLNRFSWDNDPWRDLRRLQRDMNRLFGESAGLVTREYPAVNIWTGDEDIVVSAEIPGMESTDLDITVHENTLTLRGSLKGDKLQKGETYHRQERGNGSFVRSVQLPFAVEANKVDAKLEKGILSLTLPRAESEKPKKIEIKTT